MRIAFAGTPAFAVPSLRRLAESGHELVRVWTQPDRASGRGLLTTPSAVKQYALGQGLALWQPASVKAPETWDEIRNDRLDLLAVAAYGLILPQVVLDLPRLGCLNVHASLLPRWRGAAPVQRAILAGDSVSGVCIMRMEAGLDTGPVYAHENVPIDAFETSGSLTDKLATRGADLLLQVIERLARDRMIPTAQSGIGLTYATKIAKSESIIDWTQPALQIERLIRAFSPSPGASTLFSGQTIKIWLATVHAGVTGATPGSVLEADLDRIRVACADGSLQLLELQRAGGKRLLARDFLRGCPLPVDARLGT